MGHHCWYSDAGSGCALFLYIVRGMEVDISAFCYALVSFYFLIHVGAVLDLRSSTVNGIMWCEVGILIGQTICLVLCYSACN